MQERNITINYCNNINNTEFAEDMADEHWEPLNDVL
jgi:hypothetical protein